jgi:hypothetical protein
MNPQIGELRGLFNQQSKIINHQLLTEKASA